MSVSSTLIIEVIWFKLLLFLQLSSYAWTLHTVFHTNSNSNVFGRHSIQHPPRELVYIMYQF